MTLIVNLFAGPGTGKSTMAAELFFRMKREGMNCELVREYAKDLTWEGNFAALKSQLYVTAEQHYRQQMVIDKVDVAVTDSPILLGLLYDPTPAGPLRNAFRAYLFELFTAQNNLNVFLRRTKAYNPIGRNQTEDEARELDEKLYDMLIEMDLPFIDIGADSYGCDEIFDQVRQHLVKAG